MSEKFVSIKRAADMLQVSALTLRNWDKNGKFKALRHPINNYRVYKRESIDKLIEEMETNIPIRHSKKIKKLNIKHE